MELLAKMTRPRWTPPEARVIQVIEVIASDGKGTQGDPARNVYYYYTLKGIVLARHDEWEREQEQLAGRD